MKTEVHIDGSLLAFRAAAAGEERSIKVTKLGSKKSKPFGNRTAFKAYLKGRNDKLPEEKHAKVTDYKIEDVQDPLPVKESLHIAKEIIQYIVSACDADEYHILLDADGDTFRHKLATVQQYKGNRTGKVKPANLQAVKDYLVMHHGAEVISDIEVDDEINIRKYEGAKKWVKDKSVKVISASFDKDDLGNRGWSFDFRKEGGKPLMREPLWISGLGECHWNPKKKSVKGVGRKFLYYQWVGQDSADNYKARKLSKKRVGDKGIAEKLNACTTDAECVHVVAGYFKEWYPEPVSYTSWDGKDLTRDWVEISQEYLDLARMLRWRGDVVRAEDVYIKMGVDVSEGRLSGESIPVT